MKFGLFGINNGPCAFPKCAAAVARAAEDAGFESVWTGEHVILPDPQAPPSPVAADYPMLDPAICAGVRRGAYDEDSARHRHHHIAAAKPGGARQGTRVDRRAVERAADFRNRRRIPEAGVRRDWRAVRSQGRALRGMAGGDDRVVVDAEAGVQRQVDLVQGRQCDAAAGAAAASRDRVRRAYQGGVQPGGAPREGMVRICAGPRRDREVRRGAAGGVQGGEPSVRGRRDKYHAESASEGRSATPRSATPIWA